MYLVFVLFNNFQKVGQNEKLEARVLELSV